MYQEIREKRGLSYSVGGQQNELDNGYCNLFYTTTSQDKMDAVKEVMINVLSNPTKFITKERFDIIKSNLCIKNTLDNLVNTDYVSRYFDSDRKYVNYKKNLDTMNYDIMMEWYNMYLNPKVCNYTFFVEGEA